MEKLTQERIAKNNAECLAKVSAAEVEKNEKLEKTT
jgi:hypothetical protein